MTPHLLVRRELNSLLLLSSEQKSLKVVEVRWLVGRQRRGKVEVEGTSLRGETGSELDRRGGGVDGVVVGGGRGHGERDGKTWGQKRERGDGGTGAESRKVREED